MAYVQQHVSRSTSAILVAVLGLLFSTFCFFLVVTTSAGIFGIVLAIFGLSCAAYSIYFWLRPVTWMVEVSDQSLRWQSPHLPRLSRELALSDILAVWVTSGETETVELRLISGDLISLPPACVHDPRELVAALLAANPKIRNQRQ